VADRLSEQLKSLPADVRPIVEAARRLVVSAAPRGVAERLTNNKRPTSPTYMWKLVRYAIGEENLIGIGTFPKHSAIWFDRGRELDDPTGLLQGSGKNSRFVALRSVADAQTAALKNLIKQAFQLG
jgi:hypothetical protein